MWANEIPGGGGEIVHPKSWRAVEQPADSEGRSSPHSSRRQRMDHFLRLMYDEGRIRRGGAQTHCTELGSL